MKKLIALCVMLGMTTAFAGFDMQTEMRTGWNSTTVGDADAVTATESSIDEMEFGYRGEIKEGWSYRMTMNLHSGTALWRYGYLQKQMDKFTFRVGRIGILSDDYEYFNAFTILPNVTLWNQGQDGAEVAYEIMKGHTVKLQSHLNTEGNFGTMFASYTGSVQMAKWAVYYAKAVDAGAAGKPTQMGGDVAVMLNKITLSFDYRNYKLNADADVESSMIFGAKYDMGAYTPYVHVAMEALADDLMTVNAGVKMNWGGPNYYVGGNYTTADASETTIMGVQAGLEYDFSL